MMKINSNDMPGLYQAASQASRSAQSRYFTSLRWYLSLLVCAAVISYALPNNVIGAFLTAGLFLATLGILILMRVRKPEDTWYNGRAIAESVKTMTWRWIMRSEPYQNSDETAVKHLISDLKTILDQNKSLSHSLQPRKMIEEPISKKMREIRQLPISDRLSVYLDQRIKNQANWYMEKAHFNKLRAKQWFWVSVFLHILAITMLLYKINEPAFSLPIEVISTMAGAVLSWLQAKKHNELNSAYTLTAHEITLIIAESSTIKNERQLSKYVLNSETAFSREHTQWVARKVS